MGEIVFLALTAWLVRSVAHDVKRAALSDFEEAVAKAVSLVERDFWNKAVAAKKDLDAARPAADVLVRETVPLLTTRRCRLIVRLSCQSFDDMVQAAVAKHGTPW